MGRYVDLEGGTAWLEGEGSLVAATAESAELEAQHFIDAKFGAWDRSAWFVGTLPPEVDSIAKKYASAEYLRRRFNKASPDAGTPEYASTLFNEAKELVADIRARGYLVDVFGNKILPDSVSAGGMFPEVWR